MAMPAGNIISLPFRQTQPLVLSSALKQYISTKYDQHPDMFTDDLSRIDELRRRAVSIQEPHPSGVQRIQAYAAQLVWMGGKFPIDVGADFVWSPALGYDASTPMAHNNIRFELANVLYNLAALYCQLAVASNTATPDGLRAASNYFCESAGVISHLKTIILPELRSSAPSDMDPMTLESLEHLLLAQAQECFWQKAAKDGLKDGLIAKLAAAVSDLYLQSYEYATKSNAISSEWIHHISAKHNHFAGAAQYRAARDCLERRKYGEEVARLRDSVNCANNALKESRYVNAVVLADLNGLKTKVSEDLRRAERDNDAIYLIPVPPKPELKMLDRQVLVKPRVPKEVSEPVSFLGEKGEFGQPLFAKLVPYSVHVAASIYVNRRDQLINSLVEDLEGLTSQVHEILRSLNLPGALQALEKPLGIPPGILSHAEELREQNALDRLSRSAADVGKLKTADRATYNEAVALLRSELGEDESARRKYGTERWRRPQSQQIAQTIYNQVTELDGYLNQADDIDRGVREKLRDHEKLIGLLSSSDRAIEEFVPSSRHVAMTTALQKDVTRLRSAMNEVARLETKRKRRIESLRSKAQADDVNPELLKEAARLEREFPMKTVTAIQFEDFFDTRLQRYEGDRNIIDEEREEQSKVLEKVAAANSDFLTSRRGDSSSKSREQALQKLENAYFTYKEIIQNLNVGRKFYNDLAGHVAKFKDDVFKFVYERRTEAAQLESDIANALPIATLSLNQEATQSHQQRHSAASPNTIPVATHRSTSHRELQSPPLPAPVPVKPAPVANMKLPDSTAHSLAGPVTSTWDPDMGIRFSGVASAQNGTAQASSADTTKNGTWDAARGLRFGK